MKLGPPPVAGEDRELPEEGLTEAIITDVKPVTKPQQFWKDSSKPEGQMEWSMVVREGEAKGFPLKLWTGDAVGRHPKNKLVKLLKVVDSTFSVDEGFFGNTEEERYENLRDRTIRKPLRIIITHEVKPDKEDKTRTYTVAKVTDSFLRTTKPDLDVAEQLLTMGATEIGSTEPPPGLPL